MALTLVITDAGRAALVNARNDGTNAVRIASAGVSATAVVASPAATALPGETKRVATITGGAVALDVIHLVVQDETMDSYTLRSFALYLNNGVLFALYGQATPIIEKSAQALMLLAIDVTLQDVAAGQVTFGDANFLLPPATTDRLGMIELATLDEAREGADAVRALTPATAKAAVRNWIGYTPANKSGDTFEGPVSVRHSSLVCGLRVSTAGSGYGFIQLGEAANANTPFNWHLGSQGDGSFGLYQGLWGSGTLRLAVTSTTISYNNAPIWHANNDGAGSGLDADLLDGLHAADFIRRNSGGRPVEYDSNGGQMFIGTDTGGWDIGYRFRDSQGSTLGAFGAAGGGNSLGYLYVGPSFTAANALRVYPDRVTWGGSIVWHAANDGAGSGLDADLLDGFQASQFIRSDVATPIAANVAFDLANTTWGRALRVGGNGYTAAGQLGSIVATNGAVHIDAAQTEPLYLNYYAGSGVIFGTGTGGTVASVSKAGLVSAPRVAVAGGVPAYGQIVVGPNDGPAAMTLHSNHSIFSLTAGVGAESGTRLSYSWVDGGQGPLIIASAAGEVARFGASGVLNLGVGLTRAGNTVWDAGNDGAGSGLDADMLDGLQASQFIRSDAPTPIAANVAFDVVNSTWGRALRVGGNGYTAGGAHGSIVATDGSVHVDAAQGKSLYLNYYAGEGVIFGTGTGGTVASLSKAGLFSTQSIDTGAIRRNGFALFGPDNDGAGSGLDADLLDGRDSSSFANAEHGHSAADIAGAFPGSLSENGYTVLPNGLILQWVTGALMGAGQETTQLVYFPVAFPNICFGVVASTRDEYFSRAADVMFSTIGAPATDTVTVGRKQFSGSADDQVASRPFIVALGR